MTEQNYPNLKKLIDVVEMLRGPDGCPWDKEQTHKSLKQFLLNESYELIDAIDNDDDDEMAEELGDVLLQVVLHAQIAKEAKKYDIDKVSEKITNKLIKRHPHVFGDVSVKNSDEVIYNWEQIKRKEKPERTSVLDGVPKSSPELMRAYELSKKAVKIGFEWPNIEMLWGTIYSEIDECKEAIKNKNKDAISEEIGDLFFTIVNLARWYKLNPEISLQEANKKFEKRFKLMETLASQELSEYNQPELEALWQQAKQELKKGKQNG